MTKNYASSVYSQKSTTSAKSGRSFLSFTADATIWPTFTIKNNQVDNEDATPPASLQQAKQGIWKNLKTWIPSPKKLESDDDAITIKSSSGSISSSTSSLGKWKKLLVSPLTRQRETPPTTTTTATTITTPLTTSSIEKPPSISTYQPGGILVNMGDGSAQDLAEQKARRKQRRLYLMRVQQPSHRLSSCSSIGSMDDRRKQVGFSDLHEYSSSSTLLSTPPDDASSNNNNNNSTMIDKLDNGWYSAAPRVMFVEPSPVPRFRNEPPAPPPSPPYLNVIVQPQQPTIERHCLITDNEHSDRPTIFTTLPQQQPQNPRQQQSHLSSERPRLVFKSPLERGQTITFSLQNTIPDDHIIIYKFLTSNTTRSKDTLDLSTSSWTTSSLMGRQSTERYFVRPSAGQMAPGEAHSDIMLFLNQVPPLAPGEILKDKILVRWAVIQRGTQIEAWAKQLKESNRRKWLEMLLEEWPDQVVERRTRIGIRFV